MEEGDGTVVRTGRQGHGLQIAVSWAASGQCHQELSTTTDICTGPVQERAWQLPSKSEGELFRAPFLPAELFPTGGCRESVGLSGLYPLVNPLGFKG